MAIGAGPIKRERSLADRFARHLERLAQHGLVADVIGQQQHQPRVEGGAVGIGKAGVRLDDGGVEPIRVFDVGLRAAGPWRASKPL